ncbi:MAG: hypothetical protein NZ988_02135 [Thaumarchaeota archaeon]|nr:hypothetical protein [Candidatus Calditenuaceae archaeon]MDW8186836.1 hypothetical protein [Nitrososphaerota archaeon]
MTSVSPSERVQIALGGSMLVSGFLLSFMMVIGAIDKDVLLSFLAYALSLAGLAIGLHGIYGYVSVKR